MCYPLCTRCWGWGRGPPGRLGPGRAGICSPIQSFLLLTGMNLAQLCSSAGPPLAWPCWVVPFSAARAQSRREPTASHSPIALDPQLLPESTSESAYPAQPLSPATLLHRTRARLNNTLGRVDGGMDLLNSVWSSKHLILNIASESKRLRHSKRDQRQDPAHT